ncbi:hypothetical protein K4F52_005683 [Lecanicillium sp. MT-2017a]|nr:hypothetical protein K4F52_005683 [Lecanicillium sp. MT-2017a]
MADYDYTHKAWTKFSAVKDLQSPNVKVLQGTVTNVDCVAKQVAYLPQGCQLQQVIDYDYMVVSTGMRRDWPVVPRSVTYSDYLHEVGNHIEQLQDAQYGVVVVGGGAVGIEVAAELKLVMPHLKVTLVHSREKLMSSEPLTDECKQRALEVLRRANVDVILNRRFVIQEPIKTPDSTGKYQVNFSDGSHMQASAVVMAISNGVPSTHFLPTTALDEQGYVRIRANRATSSKIPS